MASRFRDGGAQTGGAGFRRPLLQFAAHTKKPAGFAGGL
jgi:hypothetical protein